MEDISRMVTELNSKIEAKREIIEPLLNRVRYTYTKVYSRRLTTLRKKVISVMSITVLFLVTPLR